MGVQGGRSQKRRHCESGTKLDAQEAAGGLYFTWKVTLEEKGSSVATRDHTGVLCTEYGVRSKLRSNDRCPT